MTYYFGIFFLASKYFLLYLNYKLIYDSLLNYILLLFEVIYLIIFCKYILKNKLNMPIQERLYSYCLEYSIEKYYSLFVVSFSVIFYFGIILFLRIKSFNYSLDLGLLFQTIVDIYYKYFILILILNFFLLILILYLIILAIKIIRNYINNEIIKLHFYFVKNETYINIHRFIAYYCSVDALIIEKINNKLFDLKIKLALGYYKNFLYFTKEENSFYDVFCNKYDKYFPFNIIRNIFYNLHVILFISCVIYDIIFNNFILTNIFKFLPFMLLYQTYLNISDFVYQKPLTDICAQINLMFYNNIQIVNKKTVIINNLIEDFDLEEIITDFIKYENSGFTKY